MNEKALRLLGLARRASLTQIGEEPAGIACRTGQAKLLLVAKDAGDHTFRRARSFCHTGKPSYVCVPFTKEELGNGLGVNACALVAVTDAAMALAFLKELDEPEKFKEILDALEKQNQRVRKRQQEQKAHIVNIKHGKK